MHKLLLGRDPITGEALALQPTLSRFGNDVTRGELLAMSEALFVSVLDRHRKRRRKVRRITVDLDVTEANGTLASLRSPSCGAPHGRR
jgi:hypothetical protein